jgi:hypothetical protein
MTRAKKARARRRTAAAPLPASPRPRIEAASRRASVAKAGVVGVAIVGFAVTFALSRFSYAGHVKRPLRPLAAPPRYVRIVRRNLLQAGIVAPAQAPPGAASSTS